MQIIAHKVIGIKTIFLMCQRGGVGVAQVVFAITPRIAQHAPAARTQQHGRGAGTVAFFPTAGIRNRQAAAFEFIAAILLAATKEAFTGIAGQHLHGLRCIQIQRLQFMPQRKRLAGVDAIQ